MLVNRKGKKKKMEYINKNIAKINEKQNRKKKRLSNIHKKAATYRIQDTLIKSNFSI